MTKSNNKGFSLVEIIIAVAIFAVLITPVIKQLAASMSISKSSKRTQEGVEYAEYIMEYFKSADLDDIGNDDLFGGTNPFVVKEAKHSETKDILDASGSSHGSITYVTQSYQIPNTSPVTYGVNNTQYYAEVDIDTKSYVAGQFNMKEKTEEDTGNVYTIDGTKYVYSGGTAFNPNSVSANNLKNIDSTKVAVIGGDTGNFDVTVSDAFFSAKMDKLREVSEETWQIMMYGDNAGEASRNIFRNDTVQKITRITVKPGGAAASYHVSCDLEYKDVPHAATNKIQGRSITADPQFYNAYSHTFTATSEVPSIYLFFNPCIYNGSYLDGGNGGSDDIVLDTSALPAGKKVKLYIITSANGTTGFPAKVKEVIDDYNAGKAPEKQIYSSVNLRRPADASDEPITPRFNLSSSSNKNNVSVYTNIYTKTLKDESLSGEDPDSLPDYAFDYTVKVKSNTTFTNIRTTHGANTAPGADFVKRLSEDTELSERLYTVRVKLYRIADEDGNGVLVADFVGTRGAD